MKQVLSITLAALCAASFLLHDRATAQAGDPPVTPEMVKTGEKHYSINCAPCHGTQMNEPPVQVDLRKFPKDERGRFVSTVTNGRRGMPPWRGALSPEEIDAIWAYVFTGAQN